MKKINGYWTDKNNNRWNCDFFTEKRAEELSKTMVSCSDCYDCSRCSGCSGCSGCSDCSDCYDCYDCSRCSDCYRCSGCSGCSGCYDCYDCSRCSGCSGCSDCSDYKQNPQRYVTPAIGSRKSQTTIYWTNNNDVQIICGCFKGNIEEFETAVKKTHSDNEHSKAYKKQIDIFKMLIANSEDK